MKITCTNDKGKPNDVLQKDWLEEGKEYTVVGLKNSLVSGIPFFILEEIQPGAPYGGYAVSRFSIPKDANLEEVSEELVSEVIVI